ncbi:hexokinase-domain-containing protein [Circinella umbellata]|nr:hexokinase-domain-containing protein [Circinella umbellata]
MHLTHCSPQQQAAIDEIRQLLQVSNEQLHTLVHGFEKEMDTGLANVEGQSGDLKMIPSYVTGYPTGNEKGTYLALEISGVDIYVCQVKLKGEGGKLAINQYQYEIPDDLSTGDDISILIDYVADCVSDFQRRVSGSSSSSTNKNPQTVSTHQKQSSPSDQTVYSMAISLGFAVRQTGLDRGTFIALEHGFEYPNVIGRDVVDLFQSRFQAKGLNVRIVAIANAHAYQHPATRIGIVHNIGTNCAYYEKVGNIDKSLVQQQQQQGEDLNNDMIISTEWCNFGSRRGIGHLPMNRYDHLVDGESNNQGIHIFEKMTTGMYLGEIVRQILVDLVDRQILSFQTDDDDGDCLLRTPYHFDTSYMYVCEADDDWENLEDTRVVLEEMCKVDETTQADREIVKKICELVGQRAAMLLGANIASVVKHMVERGVGLNRNSDGFAIGEVPSSFYLLMNNTGFSKNN